MRRLKVCYWPKADIPSCTAHVRFWGCRSSLTKLLNLYDACFSHQGRQMRRREFITLIGGAATWPLIASAQQPTRPIFGVLLVFSQEAGRTFTEPLRAYMQALGYVEGRNITFDIRYADGKADRLPTLAAELVAQRPAVIATFGDATGLAVKAATSTIPIVSMSEDLVRAKLVTNM